MFAHIKKGIRTQKRLQNVKLENSPEFNSIVDLVISQNPLQKKRIEGFIKNQDQTYWDFCEYLSKTLNEGFFLTKENRVEAANAYNKMCMDFLREQIKFKKTGKYSLDDSKVAEANVYNDMNVMRYYMLGLLLSYMLWPNHYQLYRFLVDNLPSRQTTNYLEVGVGHGLFSSTILRNIPNIRGTCIDISETSIELAKTTLRAFGADMSRIEFVHNDYLTAELPKHQFEYIVLGEVLEHVNNAPEFMSRTRDLLAPGGRVYMTTCANCPAVDHVYHFKCVKEIRKMMIDTGFKIVLDSALPADDVPEEKWMEELTTINYCCILE